MLSGRITMMQQAVPSAPGIQLNDDDVRRNEILELRETPYEAGVKTFAEVDVRAIRALVEEGFVLAESRAPRGLSVQEFVTFMERWPEVRAHGCIVAPGQRDYGVRIEGLECLMGTVDAERRAQLREEFAWLCGDADDYFEEDDYLYAWWD